MSRSLALLGLLLAVAAPARALDVVVGNGTAASCTEAALDSAIAAILPVGGSIRFACGGPATIKLTSHKTILYFDNPNLVYSIDGGGLITLDGQNATRHFFHNSGTLDVANITFTRGYARGPGDNGSGGAIRTDRTVTAPVRLNLNNVTFTANTVEVTVPSAGLYPFDHGGGAVFARLAYVSVVNCRFSGNLAANAGGGALHGRSSAITVSGSVFDSNTSNAAGLGGAIHIDGVSPAGANGAVQISASTFTNNSAFNEGGAIFMYFHPGKGEQAVLDTVNVVGNRVVDSGRIDFVGDLGWGGGVTTNLGTITISNSTFSGNSARGTVARNGSGVGGGAALGQADAITILNSTFSGNRSFGGSASIGGGLHVAGNLQPFQIVHSTITLNQAGAAGGGIFSAANGVLVNTIVAGNTGGSTPQCSVQLQNGGGALQYPDSAPRCANGVTIVDPLLAALASNGGFTQTHHPQPGSPVIDAVGCSAAADQRGVTRPQGPACEAGSVEVACSVSLLPLTLPTGRVGTPYSQVFTVSGGTNPVTIGLSGGLPVGMSFNSSTRTLSGTPASSGAFTVTVSASDAFSCDASRTYNLAIASTVAIVPAALAVDAAGNGVLERNETAIVDPSWTNQTAGAVTLTGGLSSFRGPAGATYTIDDASAAYGTVLPGATARCSTASGNCHSVSVAAGSRPETHWDASVVETLNAGGPQAWTLHVGGSFTDVPSSSPYYRFVETLLHRGVTAGCGAALYCPSTATSREQMALFVLLAREGASYSPPACSPPNTFTDVPETSPYCRFIEELARRGVVGGCGGSSYCPASAVTREQMSVFVLRTLDPALNPPACTAPIFSDLPASSPYCRWVEELARRGVVSGCGSGRYCPTSPVTREQMGVFLSRSFGLTLYGP